MAKKRNIKKTTKQSSKEIEYLVYSGSILIARLREKEDLGCELCPGPNGKSFLKIYINNTWVGTIYPKENEPLSIKKVETEINLKEVDVLSSDLLNPSIRKNSE